MITLERDVKKYVGNSIDIDCHSGRMGTFVYYIIPVPLYIFFTSIVKQYHVDVPHRFVLLVNEHEWDKRNGMTAATIKVYADDTILKELCKVKLKL